MAPEQAILELGKASSRGIGRPTKPQSLQPSLSGLQDGLGWEPSIIIIRGNQRYSSQQLMAANAESHSQILGGAFLRRREQWKDWRNQMAQ